MSEAFSTQNLVALPITGQELDGGGGLFCSPTKMGLSNSPTTIGLKLSDEKKLSNIIRVRTNKRHPKVLNLM